MTWPLRPSPLPLLRPLPIWHSSPRLQTTYLAIPLTTLSLRAPRTSPLPTGPVLARPSPHLPTRSLHSRPSPHLSTGRLRRSAVLPRLLHPTLPSPLPVRRLLLRRLRRLRLRRRPLHLTRPPSPVLSQPIPPRNLRPTLRRPIRISLPLRPPTDPTRLPHRTANFLHRTTSTPQAVTQLLLRSPLPRPTRLPCRTASFLHRPTSTPRAITRLPLRSPPSHTRLLHRPQLSPRPTCVLHRPTRLRRRPFRLLRHTIRHLRRPLLSNYSLRPPRTQRWRRRRSRRKRLPKQRIPTQGIRAHTQRARRSPQPIRSRTTLRDWSTSTRHIQPGTTLPAKRRTIQCVRAATTLRPSRTSSQHVVSSTTLRGSRTTTQRIRLRATLRCK